MICDTLDALPHYRGLLPNLDRAIALLPTLDLEALPMGITELDGKELYVNKMEVDTQPDSALQFEFHRDYIDLQIDLSGAERILTGERGGVVIQDYAPDVGFVDCAPRCDSILGPGRFYLCFPNENHKPCVALGWSTEAVRKVVLKIRV